MLSTLLPAEDEVKEYNKQVLKETTNATDSKNNGSVRFAAVTKLVPCLARSERSASSSDESDDTTPTAQVRIDNSSCMTTTSPLDEVDVGGSPCLEPNTCARSEKSESCNEGRNGTGEISSSPNRAYDFVTCTSTTCENTDSCLKGQESSTSSQIMTKTPQPSPENKTEEKNHLQQDQHEEKSTRMSVLTLFQCGKAKDEASSSSDEESVVASSRSDEHHDKEEDVSGYETAPSTMDEDESDDAVEKDEGDKESAHDEAEVSKNLSLQEQLSQDQEEKRPGKQEPPEKPVRSFLPRKREYYNRGLRNLGNTCYLNAAVQMIATLGPFLDELEAFDKESECLISKLPEASQDTDDNTEEEDKPSLRKALLKLAQSLHLLRKSTENENAPTDEVSSKRGAVDPSEFKKAMDQLTFLFEGYRQQDSHEFLSTVLDLLQDEILMEEKKRRRRYPSKEEADQSSNDTKSRQENHGSVEASTPTAAGDLTQSSKAPGITNRRSLSNGKGKLPSFSELETSDISSLLHDTSTDMEEVALEDCPKETTNCAASAVPLSPCKRTAPPPHSVPLLLGGRTTALMNPGISSVPSSWTGPDRKSDASMLKTTNAELAVADVVAEDVEGNNVSSDTDVTTSALETQNDQEIGGKKNNNSIYNSIEQDCNREEKDEDANTMMEDVVGEASLSGNTNTDDAVDSKASPETLSTLVPAKKDVEQEEPETLQSPVEKHFGALVEVRLVCDSCSYTRSKTEAYRYFSLDINVPGESAPGTASKRRCSTSSNTCGGVATVEEGLRSFFEPEKIELKCEKCFCENATEYKEIVRLPKALLLHFKRFIVDFSAAGVTFRKNKSRVEFGEEVSLDAYCNRGGTVTGEEEEDARSETKEEEEEEDDKEKNDDPSDNANATETTAADGECDGQQSVSAAGSRYELKSIVHHIGSSASCGHYTADALRYVPADVVAKNGAGSNSSTLEENLRKEERRWLRFNDQCVTEMSSKPTDNHTQSTAYMVMYELVN